MQGRCCPTVGADIEKFGALVGSFYEKHEAKRMYKELEDSSFKYEHCWEILKKNPKWCSQQLTKTGHSKKEKAVDDIKVETPPTQTTPLSSHKNGYDDVDCLEVENPNADGVPRPPGRKNSKEKKRRVVEPNGVIEILTSFQNTIEKQYASNQQELELKKEREKKDYEVMKRDLELKEKAQQLKEKVEERKGKEKKRQEQERILNIDLAGLQPALRKAYEKMQAQIMKEWEKEGLFGDGSEYEDVEI